MDYPALVHRIRELVWEKVPAGSNVAVVSKGDADLVLFDQRQGWHFPQTASGQYLGHHPATGAAAVAHLEDLRRQGAEYFVVPATAAWWLDYYADLRRHLERRGELVHHDEHCWIYSLGERAGTPLPTGTAAERQLRDLVTAVLPEGCAVLAVGVAVGALAGAGFDLRELPEATGLDDALEDGYLVIPAQAGSDSKHRKALLEVARRAWRPVLDQRHVAAVFAAPAPPAPAKAARR